MSFDLTQNAKCDLNEILNYVIHNLGDDKAFELEGDLLETFERLAVNPGLGHRRFDLTPQPDFFFAVLPYLIVYDPQADPLLVLRILHSARDLRRILGADRKR